jgi:PPP family 3-phenylpropionic acid transporter
MKHYETSGLFTKASIKKQSLYLKALFFLFFVALGIGSPFFGIFYKHVLVNADGTPAIGAIGLIFFVMPLVSLIANIPAGILADTFRLGKRLVTFLAFGVAVFACLVGLTGEDFARDWGLGEKFIFIFGMLFFMNCCLSPLSPMIDAEALLFLNRHSRREWYGAYRLWGTYGWSIATVLMGVLLFHFGSDSLIFYGAALAFGLLGLVSWSGIEARPPAAPIRIPWDHLKKDTLFQRFLIFIFLNGVVSNAAANYTGYFFDDVMKTPLEIGLIFGTWTLFEIPVMRFSRALIETFGNARLIMLGLLFNGLRLILFSLFTLETPYFWKVAAALLQGPGFGLTHIGIIDFVDRQAHPDMRATYMNIMNVARMSLSSAIGGIVGGWLIAQRGTAFLMQICGLGLIALIFYFVLLVEKPGLREPEQTEGIRRKGAKGD